MIAYFYNIHSLCLSPTVAHMISGPPSDENITKRLRSADGKPVRATTSQHHAQEAQQTNEMSKALTIKRLKDLLKEYKDGVENLKKLLISHFEVT